MFKIVSGFKPTFILQMFVLLASQRIHSLLVTIKEGMHTNVPQCSIEEGLQC